MVRSSRGLVDASLLLLAVAAGCSDGLHVDVSYRVVGLVPAAGGTCAATAPTAPPVAAGATRVRFTFRDHTATGPGALRCDAVLARGAAEPVIAVPRKGEPVDLWVEYFSDDGTLVARGQRADVDLTSGSPVTIYTTDADRYACAPAQTTAPRAFHSATLLPTGEVLLLGGLTGPAATPGAPLAPADGAYVTASAEIYDPVSERVYPLSVAGLTPRAFHHVVVLGTDANGDVRLAVSGGLGVAGDAAAPGNVAAAGGAGGAAPWAAVAADGALGRQGTVAVPAELLVYAPQTRTITRALIAGAGGDPFAAGGVDDVTLGTPPLIGGGQGPGGDALDALRPTGEVEVRLTGVPRIGAAVVASAPGEALWIGGDLTGTRLFDTVTQLGVAPSLSPGPPAASAGQNRAFGAAVRVGTDVLAIGGLRIVGGAITDDTGGVGAAAGARVPADRVPVGLALDGYTNTAYLAAAQLPGDAALVAGGAIGDPTTCLTGTLTCASPQSLRVDGALAAAPTGAPGLARYGHRLTRLADGTVLVSGGFVTDGAAGTVAAVATLERFEPHRAVDDPLADLGLARAPGQIAMVAGAPVAPCTIVRGAEADGGAATDAAPVDAATLDAAVQ
ncbi:MAG: hypothetical protein R3B06_32150 [Kofleriaceae bacterium]